jgi:hypothetical protein
MLARGKVQGESPTGKARYKISPSVMSFTLDARAAQPWVFLAKGFSSLMTIPYGGCQAPSLTGCFEIRQATVCPFLRGGEREWPT